MLKQTLNFTTLQSKPSDGAWGAEITDPSTGKSSWNGMVKMLIDGEADICSAGLTMIREREEVNLCISFAS